MPKITLPPNGNAQYPWAKWADLKVHRATRGKHFKATPESFRRALMMHARRTGLVVETRVRGDVVTFQFAKKPE